MWPLTTVSSTGGVAGTVHDGPSQDPSPCAVFELIRGTEVTWRRSYGTRSKCSGSGKQSTVTDDWEVRVTVPVLSCSEWSKDTEKA